MKILVVSEFTGLGSTGYSNYYKEICSTLHTAGHEVIELASYGDNGHPAHLKYQRNCPWKVILNTPSGNENDMAIYEKREETHGDAKFGAWAFDIIAAQEEPDVVLAVRDHWYDKFIIDSPAANYYTSVLSATVDSRPQKGDWLDTFGRVDILTTYNEWSQNWLKTQYKSHNLVEYISPSAANEFKILNKNKCREKLGLPKNIKLVGTVMRNQRRKRFPELFQAIKQCPNTYLYCHTAYPDKGWDIPNIILSNNIQDRVFITYMCGKCIHSTAMLYSTRTPVCSKCGGRMETTSSRKGLNNSEMAEVYGAMDLYVQAHNCLPPGQDVLLEKGWTKIEDVRPGDIALTHKNRWRKVVDVFRHENTNSIVRKFKIHADIEEVTVTDGHPLYVINKENSGYTNQKIGFREYIGTKLKNGWVPTPTFIKAKDVCINDLIVFPINKNEQDHTIILDNKEYPVNDEFARWIGLYVADGCSMSKKTAQVVGVTSNIKETENIQLCKNVMSKFGNVKQYPYKGRNAVDIKVCCRHANIYLLEHCKKYEFKKLPDWVATLPIEKQKNVLQGLFMGDGCFFADKNISIYNTISKVLSQQIKHLCRRIGLNYNCRLVKKTGNRKPQYRFEIRGNIKNGEFDTKRSSTRNFTLGDFYYYQIKSIEESKYTGLVYNFEVEEDHSYVTRIGCKKNSEGLGIPVLEASKCGIKCISTDYSAQEDVIRKCGGIPMKPLSYDTEIETGCLRAIIDVPELANLINDPESYNYKREDIRAIYDSNYSWEKTGQKWVNLINGIKPKNKWGNQPDIKIPKSFNEVNIPKSSNHDFLVSCILYVACDAKLLGSYLHMECLDNLNSGCMILHSKDGIVVPVDRKFVYNRFRSIRENINQWEKQRKEIRKNFLKN